MCGELHPRLELDDGVVTDALAPVLSLKVEHVAHLDPGAGGDGILLDLQAGPFVVELFEVHPVDFDLVVPYLSCGLVHDAIPPSELSRRHRLYWVFNGQ